MILTEVQRKFYSYIYADLKLAAQKRGIDEPHLSVLSELGSLQSCLETGYGVHHPQNNYFGIKGPGGTYPTHENIKGKDVVINDSFAGYKSQSDSALAYIDFLLKNHRYLPVLKATTILEAITLIGKSGYATDPTYTTKLLSIHNNISQA